MPLVPDGDAQAFGRYRLFAKLGSGGQADVFLAVARGTLGVDKLVVIKRARPGLAEDAAQLGDFLEEARLTLRLNHPNLVHTYEVGQEAGTHFISMEHIEGLSLKELFDAPRTREFVPAIWLRVIADALSGLSHAHGLRDYDGKPLGIVHRDISPHNLLVSYDGVAKVLDFGIARATPSGAATEVGGLTGKAAYMAPEQLLGSADKRSDLFSMGVVLWELLSGKRMFEGGAEEIVRRRATAEIPRLRSVWAEVDEELEEIVARALEKDPALRFSSANEMRQTIERYLRKTGQVVREMEVGEVLAAAFAQERGQLAARIQQAMASEGSGPVLAAELTRLPGGGGQVGARRTSTTMPVLVAPRAAGAAGAAGAERAEGAELPAAPALASTTTSTSTPPSTSPAGGKWWRASAAGRVVGVAAAIGLVVLLVWRATRDRGDGAAREASAAIRRDAAVPVRKAAGCATPLRVRVMYDMTGATKEVGTAAGKGEHDYLRAINDAGGIRGCKIEIDVQDTQYDKHASMEVYEAWRRRPDWAEVSTVFVQGTPMTQALGQLVSEDRKVMISSAFAGELSVPVASSVEVAVPSLNDAFVEASVLVRKQSPGYPYVFFQGTDYTTAARLAANFAWRQGARRMAFFYCSRSAFCTEPVDGAKTFLKALGGTEIGRDLFIELDDDDAAIERKVLQFFQKERAHKAKHPGYQIVDWIWFGNTSVNSASLGKALAKARALHGLQIQMIGNNWSVDESLHRRCGEPCVGFHVVQPFALFGDLTASGTARMLADFAKYRQLDGEAPDAHRMVQYVYGRVAVATWKLAVERVIDRGLPVTGPNLRAVLEELRNVDVEGFATIGYSATDHRPQSGVRVARVDRQGRLELIGQPLSLSLQAGWLGW